MNKLFIGSILLSAALPAWAISNIENERPNLPEEGLSGAIKIGLNGKTGNQEEQSHAGGAKIIYRWDDEIFMALVDREYGTKHDIKTTDNSFLHARWIHLLNEKWAAEGFGQWEEDEFDNLTSRVLAGGGARYLVAQQKDVYSFALGLGAFHEVEKQNLISYEETNRLWRINSYYTYKYQLNNQVTLVNTTYAQPSTDDFSDFRVLFDLGLNVKLTNSLQLKLNYQLTYDSDPAKNLLVSPPIDNYKTNTQYQTALSYNF
ncbi:hypothetical protein GCM10011613_21840 [Cellvibrio zantedeschiae]|uniref:DUF481 domain-containing protein n=1 Tax=Cellvibrio zantedeschiae TaxID=1237077 RepID=A0ABQ3B6X3_9GAMM|nr:DUF481 domain-containing protein [Cellvibrio zantedeschiae]GGY76963.1 hypothetical protein GCM10011613_21840 [Cellvibrio zantedeschiae]